MPAGSLGCEAVIGWPAPCGRPAPPSKPPSFLPPAGKYNEVALKALDQVLADAADRGLRLVLILSRNWGGPDSRVMVRRCQLTALLPACLKAALFPQLPACRGRAACRRPQQLCTHGAHPRLPAARPLHPPALNRPTPQYASWNGLKSPGEPCVGFRLARCCRRRWASSAPTWWLLGSWATGCLPRAALRLPPAARRRLLHR